MSAWPYLRKPRYLEALRAWKHGTLFGCDDLWKKAAAWDARRLSRWQEQR